MLIWKILSGLGVGEEDGGPGGMKAPLGGDSSWGVSRGFILPTSQVRSVSCPSPPDPRFPVTLTTLHPSPL